ncbi:DUF3592 domain-containing protein [Subtercola boreus]|uniref:DUF3592 domain-containing protein n=1 Tax=Subtercola boreus TaxID=120213 RepID=A0A3E0WC46_9MICO|nr:DUF3592 domain-containing protein [Subtercola boreus]RFA22090.1 hypothetical protein B7R24_05235 [Subtercola boreus]RFA22270.1 hypothetical protein B7R23_05180 [Subtercola boreus]RFA28133.1 hypothetical protein B7R25_05305 [Subtercola boreus]
MQLLFVLGILIVIAGLFLAVKAHRHLTESWLLRRGTRARGQAVTVAPPLSAGLVSRLTKTVTVISYTAHDGEARSLVPRSGAGVFKVMGAGGGVTVLYDQQHPLKEDRIRVGFGSAPERWHRVRLRQAGQPLGEV